MIGLKEAQGLCTNRLKTYQERKLEDLFRGIAGIPSSFKGRYANLVEIEEAVVAGLEAAKLALVDDVTGLSEIVDAQAMAWTILRDRFLKMSVSLAALVDLDEATIRQVVMELKRGMGKGVDLKSVKCEGGIQ